MIALIFLILAFAVLWAILPPVAVGIILVVGGGWLLALGLCSVAGRANRQAEEWFEWTEEDSRRVEEHVRRNQAIREAERTQDAWAKDYLDHEDD